MRHRDFATRAGLTIHTYIYIIISTNGSFSRSRLQGTQGIRAGSVARALGGHSREIWQVIRGVLSAELELSKTMENPQVSCSDPLL